MKGQEHVPLDITPDIRASSIHHREVRRRTLILLTSGAPGTSREVTNIEEAEEDKDIRKKRVTTATTLRSSLKMTINPSLKMP